MDNFEKKIPETTKIPEKTISVESSKIENFAKDEPMVTPMVEKPKTKKNGTNIFMAVLISVVIILLLSVSGWFLGRKYIWQPQQSYISDQFQTLDLKIQDLNANLEAEKAAAEETMEVLKEMEAMLEDMKMEEEPSEIEAYMMEEFEVPADWQTYKNDDWGIEFQYPADWEAGFEDTYTTMSWTAEINHSSIIIAQEKGTDILRDEYIAKNKDVQDQPQANLGVYNPNLLISFSEEESQMIKKELEEIKMKLIEDDSKSNLDHFIIDGNDFYGSLSGTAISYTEYKIFVEIEGKIIGFVANTSYPINEENMIGGWGMDKTVLNILKTLKFTK